MSQAEGREFEYRLALNHLRSKTVDDFFGSSYGRPNLIYFFTSSTFLVEVNISNNLNETSKPVAGPVDVIILLSITIYLLILSKLAQVLVIKGLIFVI